MQVSAVQITSLLREMAWKLHWPAKEVGKVVGNTGYKFLVSMAIEDEAIKNYGHLPNVSIVCDWARSPFSQTQTSFSSPLPDEVIEHAKNNLHLQLISSLAKYDKEMLIPYEDFQRDITPYNDNGLIRFLLDNLEDNPDFLESVVSGLYKEEAEALSDIFKALSDDCYRISKAEVNSSGERNFIIIRKPHSISFYNKLSNLFKRLAEKLHPLPKDTRTQTIKQAS